VLGDGSGLGAGNPAPAGRGPVASASSTAPPAGAVTGSRADRPTGSPEDVSPGGPGGSGGAPQTATGAGGPRGSGALHIGYQYVNVGSGGTAAVTGRDVSIGDPVADARAVTSWINAHGGLGGRRMVLEPFGVDYAQYVSNPQAAYEAVCTHFTQDVQVLAVALYVPDRTELSCLAARGIVAISDGYSLDRSAFAQYANTYWSPGSMSQDRGAELGVSGLWDARFLTAGAAVGILRYEEVGYARAEKSLRAALARKGLSAVTHTVSYSDTSSAQADTASAVLDFRSRGVTHVMVLDNSGGITFAFMQAAESQQYRPAYALTTNNSPSALQQLAPAQQLAKAQAISWWSGDVGTSVSEQTPPALPSSRAACLKIMADAGLDASGTAAGTALITCDQLLLLKAVLDRGATPTAAGMTRVLDTLGTGYTSPLTYGSRFAPGRHDAATVTRRIGFDSSCTCWRYLGPGPRA
jgi:hypothetical protein